MDMTINERGFASVEVVDTRGCVCRVQRSSASGLDAVWIFCDDPNGVYLPGVAVPHLDADQARQVAAALLALADNEDLGEPTCRLTTSPAARQLFVEAISRWGESAQLGMAMEECGELLTALNRCQRGRATASDVAEEIADVTIVMAQLAMFFGERQVELIMDAKMNRLADRVSGRPVSTPQPKETGDE